MRGGGKALKIGLIGTPQVGKTTVFQLLTSLAVQPGSRENIGIARVPDVRIDSLQEMYQPRKTTYATIEVVDIAGLGSGQTGKGREFLDAVRDVDAMVHVVRAFHSEQVATEDGMVRPMRELDHVQAELLLADWELLETRLERLQKQRMKGAGGAEELAVLTKFREALEQEMPLRSVELSDSEEQAVRGYGFLTRKPVIVLVNVDDAHVGGGYPQEEELKLWGRQRTVPIVAASAQVEVEISQLEAEDAAMFMEELGLAESGIARLAQAVYEHLGLISYFTVGEDEVRAWTIRTGSSARQAAGKIHSDIERGFIRAEVSAYSALMEHGSLQALKERGLWRLEGKDYTVSDGDVISFRFNV